MRSPGEDFVAVTMTSAPTTGVPLASRTFPLIRPSFSAAMPVTGIIREAIIPKATAIFMALPLVLPASAGLLGLSRGNSKFAWGNERFLGEIVCHLYLHFVLTRDKVR